MSDKKKILVIDDDPDIRDSISAILQSEGFNVITADNGDDGIAAVKQNNPDLVLCDMMMEKVDAGSKVAQEIKKVNDDLPVWLLSSIGNATSSTIEVEKLGFNGVFQKPVAPDFLISNIKKSLKI